jgi:hypothetical protein
VTDWVRSPSMDSLARVFGTTFAGRLPIQIAPAVRMISQKMMRAARGQEFSAFVPNAIVSGPFLTAS